MKLAEIEQHLRSHAGAIVVPPLLIRRLIKLDRGGSGVPPHERCYVIGRDKLVAWASSAELGGGDDLPEQVVLVAQPSPRERRHLRHGVLATRLWRAVVHARVHAAMQRMVERGKLDDAAVRRRIDRIGQIEFDEIRAIMRHDDQVLPPHTDREVLIEFAALFLELRHFAPELIITTFPGLGSYQRIDALLGRDLDVSALLERQRPPEVELPEAKQVLGGTSAPSFSAAPTLGIVARLSTPQVSVRAHARLLAKSERRAARGDDVGAALLAARAAGVDDRALARRAENAARTALVRLGKRLTHALRGASRATGGAKQADWSALLYLLGDRAVKQRAMRQAPEARLLRRLQRAAEAHETPAQAVDLGRWLLSRGHRRLVRPLPANRALVVARHLLAASRRLRQVRLAVADRKLLAKLLAFACERAEANVRMALRPAIAAVLDRVGLAARSAPERLARDTLAEELIDQALDRGFISFASLRDAVSSNQLKLADLEGARELLDGDALLQADADLARQLDGVYQRGDFYLRGLQKLSSLPFGTRLGRLLTLFVLLPFGGAFVILEGLGHLVNPVLGWLHRQPIKPLSIGGLLATAAFILALLHSRPFRAFARQLFEVIGLALATVFLRAPRALFGLPAVRRWFARPAVRLVLRRLLIPAGVAAATYGLAPWRQRDIALGVAAALIAFVLSSLAMGSPLGALLEDFAFEQLAPTWQVLRRQWLPGLLRLIVRLFAALMGVLQLFLHEVDERLHYREDQGRLALGLMAVAGLVWSTIAYVIRLYVTLLVEPELNPLKHFPVITVAHKLFLPLTPAIIRALDAALSPLGAFAAGAIAGLTAFLLPSSFGFFAWELKENYKLYRATRPERLGAARIGPHGETMRGLLVAGIHSGTLPKHYQRLRRAAQRADEVAVAGRPRGQAVAGSGPADGLGRFREGLRQVERSLRRFVDRELVSLLAAARRWPFGRLTVGRIDLSSNRVRVELRCADLPGACELTFEEQSGYLVAGMPRPGFVAALSAHSPVTERVFENALVGLYARAEVDLVREQIEAELGSGAHYDIADEGLLVWPGRDYACELVYRLDARRAGALSPKVRGAPLAEPPPVIDTRRLLFRAQWPSWLAWVSVWNAADHQRAEITRLLTGPSLLVGRGGVGGAERAEPVTWTPLPPTSGSALTASTMPTHPIGTDSREP